MTNDKCRKKSKYQNPKTQKRPPTHSHSLSFFVIRHSFGFRHSSFVICCAFLSGSQSRRLLPALLRQHASMRRRVSPVFFSRGLFIDERFATHLDIDFLHLAGEAVADITRYSLIPLQ